GMRPGARPAGVGTGPQRPRGARRLPGGAAAGGADGPGLDGQARPGRLAGLTPAKVPVDASLRPPARSRPRKPYVGLQTTERDPMRRILTIGGLIAAIALPALTPVAASADSCEQRSHDRKVTGTLLGALGGGL